MAVLLWWPSWCHLLRAKRRAKSVPVPGRPPRCSLGRVAERSSVCGFESDKADFDPEGVGATRTSFLSRFHRI
eukprot:9502830-Pyramimonas_sp.AAC.1